MLFLTSKFLNSFRFAFGGNFLLSWHQERKPFIEKVVFVSLKLILDLISPWQKCQSDVIRETDWFKESIWETVLQKSYQFVLFWLNELSKSLIYLESNYYALNWYEVSESNTNVVHWYSWQTNNILSFNNKNMWYAIL